MDISPVVFLIPILTSLGLFALIFGIVYMQKKENLTMIEKGMNPKLTEHRPMPYRNLKWGLLLVGSGIGLLLAYLLDNHVLYKINPHGDIEYDNNVAIYFALIAIGGGLGLILSYRIEKKELLDKK
jgi:hypothetical protein